MAQCDHSHSHHHGETGRLVAALIVIVVFLVVEIVGAAISGSLALIADAAHMVTDALALALAVSAQWFANKPPDRRLHFGYRRGQVLAAFANALALLFVLVWIVYEAFSRFFDPSPVAWRPMLIVAVLGLVANGVAFAILHGAGRDNINIRGALLHVLSDLLGSVCAVVAAIVIASGGWTQIDPLLSLVVAALILRSALQLLRETSHILLEGAPADIDVAALAEELPSAAEGVANVHAVQIWQIAPGETQLIMHARLRPGADADLALAGLKEALAARYGISETTIQLETGADCPDCASSVAEPSNAAGRGERRAVAPSLSTTNPIEA